MHVDRNPRAITPASFGVCALQFVPDWKKALRVNNYVCSGTQDAKLVFKKRVHSVKPKSMHFASACELHSSFCHRLLILYLESLKVEVFIMNLLKFKVYEVGSKWKLSNEYRAFYKSIVLLCLSFICLHWGQYNQGQAGERNECNVFIHGKPFHFPMCK